ncbi:GtrA family protein [Mesorhizobium sp. WSM3224]|jgi:putative flippase GtrA|uniref:GtrA family protein n=1 Tax=Mesorhizobium sp. WSM3224 TaxID=1040986 RepID=UPI000688C3AF|nr:GtrA family protein [Mesorhizobium sp. WSM3224]
MSAAAVSELRAGGRPGRFLVIGIGATLIYALLAASFSAAAAMPLNPAMGSVLAYGLAAVFSYAGHKYFTFVSRGAHRFEVPRFAVLTLAGLATSFALPAVLSQWLGLPVQVPIALTSLLVPLVNYVVLRHWVFARALARPGSCSE